MALLVTLLCLFSKNGAAGYHAMFIYEELRCWLPCYVFLGRMALLVTLLCLSRKNGAVVNPVMFI